jgi:VanZ family protein
MLKKYILPTLWIIIIIYLSTKSASEMSDGWWSIEFESKDKLGHLIMYTVLTYLLLNAVSFKAKHSNKKTLFFILGFGILLGILMEGIQGYFLVDRNFELLDIIANISGSFLGYILYSVINKKS